ncbi:hypothetical protein [Streptomyces sp. NBC_00470]|uniref:hypothetical protein n=1 Tax=Streptomyces sp. NBC_00470 TaxID=2975753 RepID=UPI002F90A651
MAKSREALLRQAYTGEPYQEALQWYRTHGRAFGLVPDALDPQQQLLEAAVLYELVRPASGAAIALDGAAWGLMWSRPGVEELSLKPDDRCAAEVLAQVLPSRVEGETVGVGGLRARYGPKERLRLARLSGRAQVVIEASRDDLAVADRRIRERGGQPLWHAAALEEGESQAWEDLRDCVEAEADLWSRAVRRAGLFLVDTPHWKVHAPSPDELTGPKPDRIRPVTRSAYAHGGVIASGVLKVRPARGRGGQGCTTLVLALAGALAQLGARVVVLGEEGDPTWNRLADTGATGGSWHEIEVLGGQARIATGVMPEGGRAEVFAAARDAFDIVILDSARILMGAPAPGAVDLDLVLCDGSENRWFRMETVDRRPHWVQFVSWLDREMERVELDTPIPEDAATLERLFAGLDAEFYSYVQGRAFDDDRPAAPVYDADEAEFFWGDVAEANGTELDDLDLEDGGETWQHHRAAFLAFLDDEGARRYPVEWPVVRERWMRHNALQLSLGLANGGTYTTREEADSARIKRHRAALDGLEASAIAGWGAELWDTYVPLWEASKEAGDDLAAGYGHLIEYRRITNAAEDVAESIAIELGALDTTASTLAVLARPRELPARWQADEVEDCLRELGVAGLAALPQLPALRALGHRPGDLLQLRGAAAGAAIRIAQRVTDVLGQERGA